MSGRGIERRASSATGIVASVVVIVLVAVACSPGGSRPDEGFTPNPDPTASTTTVLGPPIEYQPAYAAGPCPTDSDIPDSILGIECGFLTVPENRYDPETRDLVLPVVRLPARSTTPRPDPIVYLDGGPGGSGIDSAGYWWDSGLREDREIILVGQRGTYHSSPTLDCSEVRVLFFPQLSTTTDDPAAEGDRLEAVEDCRDRLADSTDLWAYNTAENARDIADLRTTLGIGEWNLVGISYGTRLALGIMRDQPDGVRTAVLDSTYPTGIDFYREFAANGQRAIDAFFASCEASSCGSRYPNLRQRWEALLDDLEANPREHVVNDSYWSNQPIPVRWDADRLIELMFSAMYSSEDVAILPSLIEDIEQNDLAFVSEVFVDRSGSQNRFFSDGMYRSVQCRERFPFVDRAAVEQAEAAVANAHVARALSKQEEIAECERWAVAPAGPGENDPITSEIPTLVLAGGFDPITPPAWGELAAATLPNATFVLFPNEGHGITPTPCGESIVQAFLDNPGAPPPTGCAASLPAPDWL